MVVWLSQAEIILYQRYCYIKDTSYIKDTRIYLEKWIYTNNKATAIMCLWRSISAIPKTSISLEVYYPLNIWNVSPNTIFFSTLSLPGVQFVLIVYHVTFHKSPTIIFKIFWNFSKFYQICRSPKVKWCAIITYKHGIYKFPQELPNDLRRRILGNQEISRNSLKPHRMIA